MSKVAQILANTPSLVLAHYNSETGWDNETVVAKLTCSGCNSQVLSNSTLYPLCPHCSTVMAKDKKTQTLNNDDFRKMHSVASCETCGTNYVGDDATLAAFKDTSFHCLVCSDDTKPATDDDNKDESTEKNTTDTSGAPSPLTDDDQSKETTADSDADKELSDALEKLGLKDDGSKADSDKDNSSTDDTKSTKEMPPKEHGKKKEKAAVQSSDDPEDDDDDENEDDDEIDASAAWYRSTLNNAKHFSVVATPGYDNWYLFADKTPLCIASFNDADASVQNVFRSQEFALAFDTAVKSDGKVSDALVKDFGFRPVEVKIELDDVAKQIVNDEIDTKTKDLQNKEAALSEAYDQCIGIAALGITKGVYPQMEVFRNSLIAKLQSHNMREPEAFVDNYMQKELPGLMQGVVAVAKDLMAKSPESLETLAATVMDMAPRAYSKKTTITPIAVTSETVSKKHEDNNLKGKDKAPAPSAVLSGLKNRVNRTI